MKKFTLMFVLLLILSVSGLADDGTTHTGGKPCPPSETCRPAQPVENPILVDIFDFLKSIFG
jgi:hypothetical protein